MARLTDVTCFDILVALVRAETFHSDYETMIKDLGSDPDKFDLNIEAMIAEGWVLLIDPESLLRITTEGREYLAKAVMACNTKTTR